MATEREVFAALGAIIDPDLGKDIVSLGFAKNVRLNGDMVSVDIELTTPACPFRARMQKEAESLLLALPGVKSVNVNMTDRRSALKNENPSLKGVKSIVAVSSCKGGVGKSTVAAMIAAELAGRGFKTGLLDMDLFGPSLPTLFGLHGRGAAEGPDGMILPLEKDGLKLMSFGFLLGEGPAVMRGPMVSNYVQAILSRTAWGELDYLVLDFPPGTGDVQLTITQALRLSGALIVTTRQSLSLRDVEKGIMMFEKVQVPMLGVVENMAYFECEGCGKRHHPFGEPTSLLSDKYGLETIQALPLDMRYSKDPAAAAGDPLVAAMVDGLARALGRASQGPGAVPEARAEGDEISFTWTDGSMAVLSARLLRLNCPCAACVDEMSGERILREEDLPEGIEARDFHFLGNYAVQIEWSDGHGSGIYSYPLIRKLAENAGSSSKRR
jgi:Mrp family chromosome partitioning ATPase/DUF971 family protein